MVNIKWASSISEDDLKDAQAFMRLRSIAADFTKSVAIQVPVKDVFRSSESTPLPASNTGVKKYLDKIKNGETLGPILLLGGARAVPSLVVEGFHRASACYSLDEKMLVTVRFTPA